MNPQDWQAVSVVEFSPARELLERTLAIKTRADSTGPKGEKTCSNVAEEVVPGILPIQSALVGEVLRSLLVSGEPGRAASTGGGIAAPPMEPFVKTKPGGVGATVLVTGPLGAESILPNPIRTGAVSDSAAT